MDRPQGVWYSCRFRVIRLPNIDTCYEHTVFMLL